MSGHQKKHLSIYYHHSGFHLAIILFFLAFPFVFLLIFSNVFNIPATDLLLDLLVSSSRLFAAYIIAVLLAWISAVLLCRGRIAAFVLPVFDVLQSFPTFAALPLAVYFWGPSSFTIIFFLILTVIWPILFSIISSLKLVRKDWEEAAEIMGLRGKTYLLRFLIPVSLPGVITGSIIGLGEGWEALVATEIIVRARSGLGIFFQAFSRDVFVTVFGILGFLLFIFSFNKLVWLPLLEWSHREMTE